MSTSPSPSPFPAHDPTALREIFHFQSQTYSRNSYTLHWTSLGPVHAPPLIFVHGTPWSSRVWAPLARALSTRYRVYLFDNPGFGKSPPAVRLVEKTGDVAAATEGINGSSGANGTEQEQTNGKREEDSDQLSSSLTTQAEALAILYHHCWHFDDPSCSLTGHPHVVAHDVGGLISLRANLFLHCKFASLCLVDVVAIRPFGSPFFRTVATNQTLFQGLPPEIFEGMLEAYIRGAAYKPLSPPTLSMLTAPWLPTGPQGPHGFVRQIVQADAKDVEEVEGRYRKVGKHLPVKVIWGREDKWIPCERAQELGKLLGAREVVMIQEAGHLIMLDQPEQVAVEVTRWLGEVAAAAAIGGNVMQQQGTLVVI